MPILLSDYLEIGDDQFQSTGVFNPVLDLDTRLFIDPHLLQFATEVELKDSYEKLKAHFTAICNLLSTSEAEDDIFWKSADKKMSWREVKGLCIGYSKKGINGSGIGPELRLRLLRTAKQIISKGRNNPALFELVGLLEDDFGPDRISDMTANIIQSDLKQYTKRVIDSISKEVKIEFDQKSQVYINPINQSPLILVPLCILRDLPVALDWESREIIAAQNEELRARINSIIGKTWKQATQTFPKKDLKNTLLQFPELYDELLSLYLSKGNLQYDFLADRAGEVQWIKNGLSIAKENPIKLLLSEHPTLDEVEDVVLKICNHFKTLVEHNGLNRLLHKEDGTAKKEESAQLLFYGIADTYCKSNSLMIARESNGGRGPVDFKFGTDGKNSILVEIKKSTNTKIKSGLEKQLPEYMASENAKRAIYLIIDVANKPLSTDAYNELSILIKGRAIKIFTVDGLLKESASKL